MACLIKLAKNNILFSFFDRFGFVITKLVKKFLLELDVMIKKARPPEILWTSDVKIFHDKINDCVFLGTLLYHSYEFAVYSQRK